MHGVGYMGDAETETPNKSTKRSATEGNHYTPEAKRTTRGASVSGAWAWGYVTETVTMGCW